MKVLVVVDMQNDFIDGALGTPEAQAIVPRVVEKIKTTGDIVCVTKDTHYADYLGTQEGKLLPVPHCIAETYGWNIEKNVQNALDEREEVYTYEKETFGFTYAQLEKHIVDGSCGDREIDKKICNLHYKNLHKITPMPYFKKQLPLEGF